MAPNRNIVPGRDAAELIFPFRLIDSALIGSPEEERRSTYHQISVVATGTLVACWNLTDGQRLRVMYEYAKRHVVDKIREGTLSEFEEIDLHTRNVELPCPFDPDRIESPINAIVTVEIAENKFMEDASFLALASSIIDARDNINAIFNQLNNDKLIVVVEERDLLQFFRDATTKEEFSYRLCALANAATNMNIQCLRTLTETENKEIKSIQLLELYLDKIGLKDKKPIETLRKINKLRQSYPVHGDRSKGVVEAHNYFKIEYPIIDFSESWKNLLEKYLEALHQLLNYLKGKLS